MTGNTFTNVSSPENDHDAVNKVYVDNNAGISKTGGEMLGHLDMNNFRLTEQRVLDEMCSTDC